MRLNEGKVHYHILKRDFTLSDCQLSLLLAFSSSVQGTSIFISCSCIALLSALLIVTFSTKSDQAVNLIVFVFAELIYLLTWIVRNLWFTIVLLLCVPPCCPDHYFSEEEFRRNVIRHLWFFMTASVEQSLSMDQSVAAVLHTDIVSTSAELNPLTPEHFVCNLSLCLLQYIAF